MIASYLRPSAAHIWSRCIGYAALNDALGTNSDLDDADNEVREDGTACHWLAHEVWLGNAYRITPGAMSPNGRELTDEMFSAVEDYHGVLRSWPAVPTLEQTLPVSAVMRCIQNGTPDAYCIHAGTVYVADLKFGFRPVDVWRNFQLIIYAWTLMVMSGSTHAVLVIVQPRCPHKDGPIRTWRTTIDELRPIAAWLCERAELTLAANPACTPNPGCRNCPGASACKSLQAAGLDAAETAYDAIPHILSPAELGYELTKLLAAKERIEHRINGLSAQGESLYKRGTSVPGFGMERAATRWRWREGADAALSTLGKLLGVPVMAEPKLLSPAKLRNAFPPALDVQSLYAERPTGELRLKATDPNEAVKAFTTR